MLGEVNRWGSKFILYGVIPSTEDKCVCIIQYYHAHKFWKKSLGFIHEVSSFTPVPNIIILASLLPCCKHKPMFLWITKLLFVYFLLLRAHKKSVSFIFLRFILLFTFIIKYFKYFIIYICNKIKLKKIKSLSGCVCSLVCGCLKRQKKGCWVSETGVRGILKSMCVQASEKYSKHSYLLSNLSSAS